MSFQRALVALSLTEPDAALLRYAQLLAGLGCKDFRFVHVAAPPAHAPESDANLARLTQQVEEEVRRHFGARDGVNHSCHVQQGVRIDALIESAAEYRADIILLGHRKSRSGNRSLARRLAMVAPASIWMVPEGAPVRLTSILVPIDFSDHAADAVAVATDIAARAGLDQCHALHVFFDPSTVRYDEHVHEVLGNEEAAFSRFLAQVNTHGVRVEPLFAESTHPAREILRTADHLGTYLIVMNTRGRSRAAAILLGSVTSRVMVQTRIPVLVVKHFGARMNLLQALLDHRTWAAETPKTN